MNDLRLIHSRTEIANRCEVLANEIQSYYFGRDPDLVILIPLSGAFIFAADLIREIYLDLRVIFVHASSYRGGKESGEISVVFNAQEFLELKGKDVLIVEDIIHTGKTLLAILGHLYDFEPESIEVCAFLKHPDAPNHKIVKWVGFTALPDEFVVGYGMDLEEKMRNYPGVMIIE